VILWAAVRLLFTALLGICLSARGEDVPATMTRLMVKVESPDIAKDSFAAQAKRILRAGSGYCRIEENPDLANGIHGLLITNEPDSWMINRLDKTARHFVDQGPTFNCRLPIFGNSDEIKSAKDANRPLMRLEFGREFEFFKEKSGPPHPGPVMQGKETKVYSADWEGWHLFLFTSGQPEIPVAVVRKNEKTRDIIWYGEYLELPFDPQLFAKPNDVKIEEVR